MMKDLAIGIVLYNPQLSLLNDKLKEYVMIKKIYLIDNCSSNIKDVELLVKKYKNVKLVKNKKNEGIAYALNQTLKLAYEDNFNYLLTLDQDSFLNIKAIQNMLDYSSIESVALICPIIRDVNKDKIVQLTTSYQEVNRCITSGTIMNLRECREIGYFDEKMFIDYVDFDYCKRVQLAHKKIIMIRDSFLIHEIGSRKKRKFLFWDVYPTNHNAIRIYYYSRNIRYYLRKYKRQLTIKEVINEIIYLLWKCVSIMYSDNKINKFKMFFKGLRDSKKMMN